MHNRVPRRARCNKHLAIVKLTCIKAHFVADACQRCLFLVGVSVTEHQMSHNMDSFFHRSIILSISLFCVFLVTLFVNPFFKVLQKGINNAGINRNKHIRESRARCDLLQLTNTTHAYFPTLSKALKVVQLLRLRKFYFTCNHGFWTSNTNCVGDSCSCRI